MKPTKVKAWPELVDFLPSLSVLRDVGPFNSQAQKAVEIDFGSVRTLTSTGAAIFVVRLLRFLRGRTPHIRRDCSPAVWNTLEKIGAIRILSDLSTGVEYDLPFVPVECAVEAPSMSDVVSFPLYRLAFGPSDRRTVVHSFTASLALQLAPVLRDYDLKPNGLVMLLNEIAKNTADHAGKDAFFGMDVFGALNRRARLTFAFGDLGQGIKQHIEQNLPPEEKGRLRHMSLYEAYRLALKPGYTTNAASGLNKGHGMSIIVDCAAALQVHLSVFDATSRGLLSSLVGMKQPSHASIRRIFHNVGHDVGFFYFGEVSLNRES